ncbi:type 2 isopentenyl-diphosphate Delta-isomerase [Alteribacter keqinensis]|uniref:Isopentenyl-diphosphate delta-isomerase n=1 Tax=Alteribacter keqinensis TaxID=2483800 RepID=A0A3M7TXH0_9BACI|nr:type 2 isopentenyl-diphosphate Delta-isomerase [Alteribacter keqinensis]RNA69125.1 type 2 isopentenyl-diphosphate Delta-isomerase [Alteribacter keqinensis]
MSRAKRKADHLRGALQSGQAGESGFDDITFVHQSLPDVNTSSIQLETEIGELTISSPIFINAMTGGGGKATEVINSSLAEAARELNIPIAVGSQMSALKDPEERRTYETVRKNNPDGIVIGNVGSEASVDQAQSCVDMLEADALQIHLNVIQELVMPEGDRNFEGALSRIETICKEVSVPVIVKEVGFGTSMESARKLSDAGVSVIDAGGFGGTNFSMIENQRRKKDMSFFNEWGIKTAASIAEVKYACPEIPVLSSGGIRTAMDIAKSLALGASACGMAGRILKWVKDGGTQEVLDQVILLQEELRWIMTALGINNVHSFQKVPFVISGETHHWLKERGIDTKHFSIR